MIDLTLQLAFVLIGIILLWVLIRWVMRITAKIISWGCSLAILAGVLYMIYMYFSST